MRIESNRLQEVSDRIEIQDLLARYCTAIDSKEFEMLDSVFTQDANIDYTETGGSSGKLPEIKVWLLKALSQFPMTQHIVTNFDIKTEGDHATSRCAFFSAMGLSLPEGEEGLKILLNSGYYKDSLVRTNKGWRISERIQVEARSYGPIPNDIKIHK